MRMIKVVRQTSMVHSVNGTPLVSKVSDTEIPTNLTRSVVCRTAMFRSVKDIL